MLTLKMYTDCIVTTKQNEIPLDDDFGHWNCRQKKQTIR